MDGRLLGMTGDTLFRRVTSNVAVERYFYALEKLNPTDIFLVKKLIADTPHPAAKRTHERFLKQLTVPSWLEGRSTKIDEIIEIFRTNVLEDHHTAIENSFLPLLDRALTGDISFYFDNKDCVIFLNYLCAQYMRTKGLRDKIVSLSFQRTGLDLSRIWPIWSQMFAVNIGGSVYVERSKRKLVLLHNNTGTPFITGDQPVVNLLATSPEAPTELAFYYPLAPQLALVLNEVDGELPLSSETLSSEQVHSLNARLFAASHAQIFGTSEDAIRSAKSAAPWKP